DMTVKLADFGCAKRAWRCESFTPTGSIPWMAPEVIKSESGGRAADIWSVGCSIIEMATAELPWGFKAFDNLFAAMYIIISMTEKLPRISGSIPEQARDLIRSCLHAHLNVALAPTSSWSTSSWQAPESSTATRPAF
ncbi:unnamed protein product, partial [Polarella glacialis]